MSTHLIEVWDEFPDLVEVRCYSSKGVDVRTKFFQAREETPEDMRPFMLQFMEDWSESTYSAGWLSDLEHAMLKNPLFVLLVERCGGWWTFDLHAESGRRWVDGTLDDLRQSN